ncbi:MAG: nucleotidyltransferase family protein, partial [Paraburkholderia caledonica]
YRDALLRLDGDSGARSLLGSERVMRLDVDDAGILRDIDTPDDLRALR